ncbi:hypothetical protein K488DRAFT_91320 [Vararia minispora EC-137]|uniref:Uncharacterized protein n=1 Tax=Vararia minispora EC-137 TaxID=1314806 RepID=A0ACB8Q5S0_9AGAM|nr:hypothetical protein K488DRAFT_91320 [Vararia minispora EC-137]
MPGRVVFGPNAINTLEILDNLPLPPLARENKSTVLPFLARPYRQPWLPPERPVDRDTLSFIAADRLETVENPDIKRVRDGLSVRHGTEWLEESWRYRTFFNEHEFSGAIPYHKDPKGYRFSFAPSGQHKIRAIPIASENSRRKLTSGAAYTPGTAASLQTLLESPSLACHWSQVILISPRPLGPTHILVAHADASHTGVTTGAVECAINDAVFTAHVPNLADPLPRRRDGELMPVQIHIPQLRSWLELISYMHKRSLNTLFKSLLPEWILHESFMALYGKDSVGLPQEVCARYAAEVIATYELYEIVKPAECIETAYATLDALRENLEHIGLFETELWDRLHLYMFVLREAKVIQARSESRLSSLEDGPKKWP